MINQAAQAIIDRYKDQALFTFETYSHWELNIHGVLTYSTGKSPIAGKQLTYEKNKMDLRSYIYIKIFLLIKHAKNS